MGNPRRNWFLKLINKKEGIFNYNLISALMYKPEVIQDCIKQTKNKTKLPSLLFINFSFNKS
jgi:hypothetical protein